MMTAVQYGRLIERMDETLAYVRAMTDRIGAQVPRLHSPETGRGDAVSLASYLDVATNKAHDALVQLGREIAASCFEPDLCAHYLDGENEKPAEERIALAHYLVGIMITHFGWGRDSKELFCAAIAPLSTKQRLDDDVAKDAQRKLDVWYEDVLRGKRTPEELDYFGLQHSVVARLIRYQRNPFTAQDLMNGLAKAVEALPNLTTKVEVGNEITRLLEKPDAET